MGERLSHVDPSGQASMVDVGGKPITRRSATASCECWMSKDAAQAVKANTVSKGDVLAIAKIAGIQAAKRTDQLIPLCHSVPLDRVDIAFEWQGEQCLSIRVSTVATGRTGVEMEAMVAASVAALTVYDMCKAVDRGIRITDVVLLEKAGGVRGDYRRSLEA